jgi:aspartate ammonia-lyase
MSEYRKEHDLLGELDVPAEAMYGISTVRAMENFPLARRPVNRALVHAFGAVKLACARTNHELGFLCGTAALGCVSRQAQQQQDTAGGGCATL